MKRPVVLATALLCTAAVSPKPVTIVHNNADLKFTYQYPREAATIPLLDKRFRAEAVEEYRRHLALGRVDKATYRQQQRGSVTDFYSKVWSSAGETSRLLSLQYQHSTYTGGAHPNGDAGALLWDRKRERSISVASLFVTSRAFEKRTRADYCTALDKERQKRREGWKPELPDFNACPPYADLAISPADKNMNGRFDTLAFVASPYEAGPYAEGEYSIELPVTAKLVATLKREYRNSFEAQRQ